METIYVPVANANDKRNMLADWRTTSDRVFTFSAVTFIACVISACALYTYGEKLFFINILGGVAVLLSGLLARNWKYAGYIGTVVSLVINSAWFYFGLPEALEMKLSVVAVAVVNIIPCIFSLRCVYNYKNVFKELKKSKGFPDFILNTADMFGDKMYIKDEEPKGDGDKYKASYNPFNTERLISEEEFFRSQNLKAEAPPTVKEMNIGSNGTVSEREQKKYKYGKSIFGFELFFFHDDPETAPHWENAILSGKWRSNIELCETRFNMFALLVFLSVMVSGLGGSVAGMLNYLVFFVLMFGISSMKLNELHGPFVVLGSVLYFFTLSGSGYGVFFMLGALCVNPWIIISPLRFLLNYKLFKKLSKMDGFPTFAKTTGETYGKYMYILEERPKPPPKKSKDDIIVMDIGFDEPPNKQEDKGWNAFDYMDENKENKNDKS